MSAVWLVLYVHFCLSCPCLSIFVLVFYLVVVSSYRLCCLSSLHVLCWEFFDGWQILIGARSCESCRTSTLINRWSMAYYVPRFVLRLLYTYMLCGSCKGGMCHFSCGVNVVIVTSFVEKFIMVYWKLFFFPYDIRSWTTKNSI